MLIVVAWLRIRFQVVSWRRWSSLVWHTVISTDIRHRQAGTQRRSWCPSYS